jgi:hypothetical protein
MRALLSIGQIPPTVHTEHSAPTVPAGSATELSWTGSVDPLRPRCMAAILLQGDVANRSI